MIAYVLNIPESTPSLNRIFQGHWSNRHRMRVKWAWLVRAARLDARLFPSQPLAKAKLTVERWGPRRLDFDNYVAGVKYLTDSLKTEGFIVDDSPDHILAQYIQHIGPRHTRVRIEPWNA
jgi:Holliday junction resolvase RusA-like endonuclease